MLVIGSRALNYYCKDRESNDLDIICYRNQIPILQSIFNAKEVIDKSEEKEVIILKTNDYNIECLLADNVTSLTLYLEYNKAVNDSLKLANLETLYSIKKAHIHFPIKFEKHIKDYHLMRNTVKIDILSVYTSLHFKETEKRLGKLKTPNMNQSVNTFFKQSNKYVDYIFVHDDVHIIMKHKELPMYNYIQIDSSKAECDEKLFNLLSEKEKIWTVLEEVYVIALERKIIPFIFSGNTTKYYTSEEAFKWALMRVCTTLCDGWFREYATDNYFEILESHNRDYVEVFFKAFENGEIKKNKKD